MGSGGWELSGKIDRFIGHTEHSPISHCELTVNTVNPGEKIHTECSEITETQAVGKTNQNELLKSGNVLLFLLFNSLD